MRSMILTIGLLVISTPVDSAGAQDSSSPVTGPTPIRIEECIIKLADERSLASGQSGIIEEVHVREGDRVVAGQLLAELDASIPKAALVVAQTQADSDVNKRFAMAAYDVARAEYYSVLDARKKNERSFSKIQEEKYRLEAHRSEIEIEVAEHEYKISQERRDEAATLVKSYQIIAPMDGLISRVYKAPGESVQLGETLLECQDTDTVHVEANVKVNLLPYVRRGTEVRIVPNQWALSPEGVAREAEVFGTIFFVGASAELSSESVRVLVEVDNRDGRLLAGTTATLEIPRVLRADRPGTTPAD